VRVYLPATMTELADPAGLTPRRAHAVTDALSDALPHDDDESREHAAQLAAADASVVLLAEDHDAPRRRVVVSADVAVGATRHVADPEAAPSAIEIAAPVVWSQVACVHVDEAAAAPDVTAAIEGDLGAAERLVGRDLLWYDVSELAALVAAGR
jgi:hypothetical protein